MNRNNAPIAAIFAAIANILLILFIALKVLNKIDWSWWWVLSPFWIYIIVISILMIVMMICQIRTENKKGR